MIKYIYVISSFMAGFSLMTLELVSVRLVAPIIGSSVFTWTSVIGITLLGLSLGSLTGGFIIDKYKSNKTLGLSFIASSLFVFFVPLLAKTAPFIVTLDITIFWLIILISLYLFLLPSFMIGLLQPMILKMYADSFIDLGKEYGVLSALWALGSILGVFMTGFYFVATIGSSFTLHIIASILCFLGVYFFLCAKQEYGLSKLKHLLIALLFAVTLLFAGYFLDKENEISSKIIFKKETNYYLAQVAESDIPGIGPVRILFLDFDSHSIEPKYKFNPAFFYTSIYPVFQKINPDIKDIHVIGGGAYTLPKGFADFYENSNVTVTEIDKEVSGIAKKYFNLDDKRIKTFPEDARIYFNRNKNKYDLIFGDAYNSFISVPWHLTTYEFTKLVKTRLNDNGIYAVNFISSLEGEGSKFFQSMLKTFSEVFPNYYIFAFGKNPSSVQSIILVGTKGAYKKTVAELQKELQETPDAHYFSDLLVNTKEIDISEGIFLRDDLAPVENLMIPTMKNYFSTYLKFYQAAIN